MYPVKYIHIYTYIHTMQEMFPDRELARRINPDEAIAIGAAMDASHQYKVITLALCVCIYIYIYAVYMQLQ